MVLPTDRAIMTKLTHFNTDGEAHMVDVGAKDITRRTAIAEGRIYTKPETLALIQQGGHAKGDVLGVARVAGIMAAKKKPVATVGLSDIGLDAAEVGGDAAKLRTVRLSQPPKGKGAEILSGSADEIAAELVNRIRENSGVI